MAQHQPSANPPTLAPPSVKLPRTKIGKLVNSVLEPIDEVGIRVFGSLWRTLYLTIQDAIVLSLLLKIPNLISTSILGKDFSSYDRCLLENGLGADRYACFIIVTGDFCLWIVLGGRTVVRFLKDFLDLIRKKGD